MKVSLKFDQISTLTDTFVHLFDCLTFTPHEIQKL